MTNRSGVTRTSCRVKSNTFCLAWSCGGLEFPVSFANSFSRRQMGCIYSGMAIVLAAMSSVKRGSLRSALNSSSV